MKHRLTTSIVIAALAFGGAAACGRTPEPQGPTPEEIAAQEAEEARRRAAAEEEARRRAEEEARRRAEAEEAARVRAATEQARSILQEMIHFEYDRAAIRPEAEQRLMRKVGVLRANPNVRLRIAGHADERGSVEYNRALGQRRAEAARDFLVGFGISQNRLETVSFGEDRPLVRASNEAAWAQNRRAEFTIISGGDQLRNPAP